MGRVRAAGRIAFVLVLALLAGPAAVVSASESGTGGTAPPPPESPSGDQAPAGPMPMQAPRTALVGRPTRLSGKARRARRRVVRVEGRLERGQWTLLTRVRASRQGAFSVLWRPRRAGQWELRARVGRATASGNGGTAVPVEIGAEGAGGESRLTVYQPAIATWYGPGFFGRQTACGIELTETTLGVAHRELPCGTQVQLAFADRVVVVPVIDRGPFANGADWDLTQATAQQLGISGTVRIGAMPLDPER